MSKISKNKLLKEVEDFIWKNTLEAFRDTKQITDVEVLLNDLLTPSEKIIFSKRLAIAFFLAKGLSYAEISRLLKVSSATINNVQNSLKRHGKGYEILVGGKEMTKLDRLVERLLENIGSGMRRAGKLLENYPTKSGPGRWRFLKHL